MKKRSLPVFTDWKDLKEAIEASSSRGTTPAPPSPLPAHPHFGTVSPPRALPRFGQPRAAPPPSFSPSLTSLPLVPLLPPSPPLPLAPLAPLPPSLPLPSLPPSLAPPLLLAPLPPHSIVPPPPTRAFPDWSLLREAPRNLCDPLKLRDLSGLGLTPWKPPQAVTPLGRIEESEKETPPSALATDSSRVATHLRPRRRAFPPPYQRGCKIRTESIKDLKGGARPTVKRDDEDIRGTEEGDDVLHYCEVLTRQKKLTGRFIRSLAEMGDGVETLIDLMLERPFDTIKISEWADANDFDEYYRDSWARKACRKLPEGIVRVKEDGFAMGRTLEKYSELLKTTFTAELKQLIHSREEGQVSEQDIRAHIDVDFLVAMQMMKSLSAAFEVHEKTGGGFYFKVKVIEEDY